MTDTIEEQLNQLFTPKDAAAKFESARLYKLMIFFGIATMHFYRTEITTVPGENLGQFADRHQALITRVIEEAKNTFNYELSHQQIGAILGGYLGRPALLSEPAYKPSGDAS